MEIYQKERNFNQNIIKNFISAFFLQLTIKSKFHPRQFFHFEPSDNCHQSHLCFAEYHYARGINR